MKRLPTLIALALLAAPSASAADGLPLAVDSSPSGILGPGRDVRYLAVPAVGEVPTKGHTAVLVQVVGSGDVVQSRLLRGFFSIPAVAYDGTASGLAAGGRRLVLIRPRTRFPRPTTTFAVLDPRGLRLVEKIHLRGDFSFDAISPDGRSMFLIQYLSRRDPSQYHVRVYDLDKGRLVPEPIVDPREEAEEMYGYPMSRATSPDGRWAYTLYDGREHPFIHALDTTERRAVCIDLHFPSHLAVDGGIEVSSDGRSLVVKDRRGDLLAQVNTGGDWKVTDLQRTAKADAKAETTRTAEAESGDGPPWAVIGAGGGVGVLLGFLIVWRRRRRPPEPQPAWPALDGTGNDDGAEPEPDLEISARR